ncbi:MAG TPA: caspase family protein, partial [Fimbriimonadaceae bacterium]|nr:caspase family protein [Fimbriimonadaceae bacterium]
MRVVLRWFCILLAAASFASSRQIVQSDYYTLNAGLTKTLAAANPGGVAFSRDGSLLACIDKSGALGVYSVISGSQVGSVASAHTGGKAALAFSPYGDSLATWGQDQKVVLWDAKSVAQMKVLATSGGKPGVIAYSGDGTRIACGGEDGDIRVFDVDSGAQVSTGKAHKGAVLAMAFEPTGTTIVSVGSDRNMVTSDAASGQTITTKFMPIKVKFDAKPEDEFQQIKSADCTPDGSIFAVGGYNLYRQLGGMPISFEFVVLYDRSGRRLVQIGDKTAVNTSRAVSITPDGKLVGTSAPDGKMRIWDVEHNQLCGQPTDQGNIAMTAATKSGGNYYFAIAGKSANLIGVTPIAAQAPAPDPDQSSKQGLSIQFASPTEVAPIVGSPSVEVSAVVTGLSGAPVYSVEIAGEKSQPATLQPSDNRDLVLAPAPAQAGAGQAAAVKETADTVRISQNLTLSEGPNRVKVTVQDGGRLVTAVKTICYVPQGDQLDKDKIYSNSYAIVIGINQYTASKNIPELHAAVADATDVAAALKSEYGFQNVTVLTDAQATHDRIMQEFNSLTDASKIKPNDRVVVFWSGHGQSVTTPEGGQIGFLLPSDAKVDFSNLDNIAPYRQTCIPMDELGRLAREIPAKHVLFLVDACFSGIAATSGSSLPQNTFGLVQEAYFDAKQIITASSQFEPAKEKDGHGYFTKAL